MGNDGIIVRKATKKDLGQIVDFWMAQDKYHARLDSLHVRDRRSRSGIAKHVSSSLYSSRVLLLVAEDTGRVVGFAQAHLGMRPQTLKVRPLAYIDEVHIIPAYRRRGIVKLFLSEYDNWFRKKNLTFVELSVHVKNQLGRNAFKKYGFKDAIMRMRKKL